MPERKAVRVAMWSGPRNISTALMRSWGNRPDTVVCDEPLYAHYLAETGKQHPAADEVIQHHEADRRKVVRGLTGEIPDGKTVFYQKHMAHHLLPEANQAGADDAIMLDRRGFLAETNATHVFVVTAGKVETSRLLACPEGITRQTVLDLCVELGIHQAERDLSMTELYRADEVFCTGTMGELAAVTAIDGRTIGPGEVGPLTRRLGRAYAELTAGSGELVI